LAPVCLEGLNWLVRRSGIHTQLIRFLIAANVHALGVFVFVLLFNLYLLDLGWREDALGTIAGAAATGTIAGTVPAAAFSRRFGLRAALTCAIVGVPLISALRVMAESLPAQIAGAFAGGAMSAFWFVAAVPAVARLSSDSARPLAYSLWIGSGIATGILGGLAGGNLPGWLAGLSGDAAESKRWALLTGCGVTLLALWPLMRLRFPNGHPAESRTMPSGAFVWRFLGALAVWQFALGAFNPLFNAFFATELHASLAQIGSVFAVSQLSQAGLVLLAPWFFKRVGMSVGLAATQVCAGLMLAMLAFEPGVSIGTMIFACYMSMQVMSEPGLFGLLMSRVDPSMHSGASGLNFFVTFSAHALAGAAGGWLAASLGYPALLWTSAAMCAVAALLFKMLLSTRTEPWRNGIPLRK
jgi:MFS family permease